MGIFSGLFRSRDKPQNRTTGSAYSFFFGSSSAGKRVNERSAMQMTAVYSCVRILAEAVAGLPLHLYRYKEDGGKEKAIDHPLYLLLHDEPNPEMSSFVFRETLMTHLLLWGNAYAQIIRNGKGEVIALYPLMPDRMTVDRDRDGKGTASWIDEEGAYLESDDSFGQVSIGAYKLGTMIKVSEELLNDSVFDLESYISREFARRIGAKEEEAFFTGYGSGKPLGILAATGGAETGITAASATAITADELIDLFYSLKAPYRRNAVWVLNDSTIKAIRKLKDNQGQYLWQPSLTAGAPDLLLGKPVRTSAYMPAIAADAKTIAFGDFSYYWIADRQGRSFKRLNELYAATGQVGFLASQRVDGKLILPEAIKVLAQKSAA